MSRLSYLSTKAVSVLAARPTASDLQSRLAQLDSSLKALHGELAVLAARPTAAVAPWRSQGVYLGHHRVLTETAHGVRMFLDAREMVVTPILLLQGVWEEPTARTILDLLKPGMTFVDVGAQMGYFSCLGARAVQPGGTLYAFEADPALMELLIDNVALNWIFEGAHVENVAVMDRPGHVTLWKRDKYMANSSIGRVDDVQLEAIHDRQTAVEVPAISLDTRLDGVGRVDVVKVDVEGAECRVLAGMSGLITRFPQMQILAEWSPEQIERAGDDPREFIDFVRRNGFAVRVLDEEGASIAAEALSTITHAMVQLHRDA